MMVKTTSGLLMGCLLLTSGCFSPTEEAATSPVTAGGDAGTRPADAGLMPEPAELLGAMTHGCGPTDGPALDFQLSHAARTCTTQGASELDVLLWRGEPALGTFQIHGSFERDGAATTCTALECFTASDSTLTIDLVDADRVEGSLDLHFPSGVVQGRFSVERCASGGGFCG